MRIAAAKGSQVGREQSGRFPIFCVGALAAEQFKTCDAILETFQPLQAIPEQAILAPERVRNQA